MTYDDVPPAFRIALGVHEAYRRMGDSRKAKRLWERLWHEFESQMDMAFFLAKILEKGFVVPILPAWTRPS